MVVEFWVIMGLTKMGSGVSLTLLPAPGSLFLLLGCHVQPCYEGLFPVLLYLVRPVLVDIPGRSALFYLKGNRRSWPGGGGDAGRGG